MTKMKSLALTYTFVLLVFAASATAQESIPPEPNAGQRGMDIHALISQVADDMDKEFIVDPRVPPGVGMGYTTREDANYESLLAILRLNDFATIETDEQILIVPAQDARSAPTRILQEDDSRVSDHEIVTRLIEVVPQVMAVVGQSEDGQLIERLTPQATQLVPILRPMMPQSAQLGAIPGTNTLVIVDRYDNVRRITAVVAEILEHLED